jgi:enterochelin esterase-like enzyme
LKPDKKPRRNRSLEYETLSDQYSKFLLKEIIPAIRKDYVITNNREGWSLPGHRPRGDAAGAVAFLPQIDIPFGAGIVAALYE